MGAAVPEIARSALEVALAPWISPGADPELLPTLWAHLQELRRWNPRLSLVGPGSTSDPVAFLRRHYGESLAALPWLDPGAATLVDLGSGGGFPGWVLAAARRDLRVTLVEPNGRKRAFLGAAARRAALPVRTLDARVSAALPEGFPDLIDILTVRALKVDNATFGALQRHLSPRAQVLLWAVEEPMPPAGFLPTRCSRALAGSDRRRIFEWRRDP